MKEFSVHNITIQKLCLPLQQFHVAKEEVKVFQHNSRGENFILDITELEEEPDLKDVANQLLGKVVFVSWPHLIEAKVRSSAIILFEIFLFFSWKRYLH